MAENFSELKEKEEVQSQYNKLKKYIFQYTHKQEDRDKIEKAFELAQTSHKGNYRRSGEPYIMHPLRVAQVISEDMRLDTTSILCGLLHDVVEDTSISINRIEEDFGKEVAKIIHGVTKIKKIFKWEVSEQAENFKKLLLNLTNDHRVFLVKLADRLDNMRTLHFLPRRKQLKIASETIQFYVQIAHRLGLSKIKLELEDLYLKYIYPDIYNNLVKRLQATTQTYERIIDKFTEPIEKALKQQKVKFRLKKRTKSIYSIWKKMKNKHIPLEEIYDLLALRIILDCPIEEEKTVCWQTLGVITKFYTPNTSRFRDWISIPKSNGYESLHTTVMNDKGQWIEVQIRTERMHNMASKGLIAHWQYKKNNTISSMPLLEDWIKNIEQVLQENKELSTIETIEDVQMSLYEDEINVFNQSGKMKILPKGSTVLDFAIEEKNIKGLQCSGALVSQKIASLHHKLKNGDQVELIVDDTQKPKPSWIDFVITPKARRVIKRIFKKTNEAIQAKGKKMIEAKLNKLGSSLSKKNAQLLKEFFDEKTTHALYHKIGSKKIQLKELETFIKFIKNIEKNESFSTTIAETIHIKKSGIIVNEEEVKNYKLARCCSPIPNEEIFGVISFHQAIKIHRVDCLNALYIFTHQGDKIIKAEWGKQEKKISLDLAIISLNQQSIQESIIKVFQDQCEVISAVFKKQKNFIKSELAIKIKDAKQLNEFIDQIQEIKGVVEITRHLKSSTKKRF